MTKSELSKILEPIDIPNKNQLIDEYIKLSNSTIEVDLCAIDDIVVEADSGDFCAVDNLITPSIADIFKSANIDPNFYSMSKDGIIVAVDHQLPNLNPDETTSTCQKKCQNKIQKIVDGLVVEAKNVTTYNDNVYEQIHSYYAERLRFLYLFYYKIIYSFISEATTKTQAKGSKPIAKKSIRLDIENDLIALRKNFSSLSYNYQRQKSEINRILSEIDVLIAFNKSTQKYTNIVGSGKIIDESFIMDMFISVSNRISFGGTEYSISGDLNSGLLKTYFDTASTIPTEDQSKVFQQWMIDQELALENIRSSIDNNYKSNVSILRSKIPTIVQFTIGFNQTSKYLNSYTDTKNKYYTLVKTYLDNLELISRISDPNTITTEIAKIKCCGKVLKSTTPPTGLDKGNDDNFRGISGDPNTDFTKSITWWFKFSAILTLFNLLPSYWTIGLILPSPGGPVKVPLPTVWIPLVVFTIGGITTVIFLTINGMVIVPVIWQLRAKPVGNNTATFVSIFKGAEQKIKDNVDSKQPIAPPLGIPFPDTDIAKIIPFTQDDMPDISRITITNPGLILFLLQWLGVSSKKSNLGIP